MNKRSHDRRSPPSQGDRNERGRRMRVSKEKAAKNRQQILSAAARLFRENGIRATGVDSIGQSAGVTHGAVYSQFESKEALAAEAIRLALSRWRRVWQRAADRKRPSEAFRSIVTGYLSPEHRDSPGRVRLAIVFRHRGRPLLAVLDLEVLLVARRQVLVPHEVVTGEVEEGLDQEIEDRVG